jgi:histidine transport system permease protein
VAGEVLQIGWRLLKAGEARRARVAAGDVASHNNRAPWFEEIIFACEYPRHAAARAAFRTTRLGVVWEQAVTRRSRRPLRIGQETHVFLYGFGPVLLDGTIKTIELSVLSLATAVVLGLIGAAAKLSFNRPLRAIATGYTTLIRSVPDLVLMLLLFYSIQIAVNNLTDALDLPQFDIDPFVAGVLTLGFIYGAYFTETFRGAFLAVPRGQLEAGAAYGMSGARVFARILFPQMMRFALPGIGNNWQVLVKATALVSIIGLADVVKAAQDAGKSTFNMFFFILVAAAIYLAITTVSNLVLIWLEKRYSIGVRHAEL